MDILQCSYVMFAINVVGAVQRILLTFVLFPSMSVMVVMYACLPQYWLFLQYPLRTACAHSYWRFTCSRWCCPLVAAILIDNTYSRRVVFHLNPFTTLGALQIKENSKNPRLLWKWVGGVGPGLTRNFYFFWKIVPE